MGKIKQIFCKHEFEYIDMEYCRGNKYWFYRCRKCGTVATVDLRYLRKQLENPSLEQLKEACSFSKDTITLPKIISMDMYDGDIEYCSRLASGIIAEMNKRGIDLTEYGRRRGAVVDENIRI